MTHINYILIGLLMLIIAVIITPNVSMSMIVTALIDEFKNNIEYACVLSLALMGTSYFVGGALTYHLFDKED